MSKIDVWDRPKSKWPFWVMYVYDSPKYGFTIAAEDYDHILRKVKLMNDKIPVVVERQWGYNTSSNGKKYKTQFGVLYKFQNSTDRLMFLLENETSK